MKYLALAIAALSASAATAHPDHDEVRTMTPTETARQHVVRMVTQGKLATSWSKAAVTGTSERKANGATQTVVTMSNPAEAAARRVLRVTVAADGSVAQTAHSAR
jgi:hypothetical protein